MGHLFGHFHQGGVGVRFFADMALYMKNIKTSSIG